MSKLAISSFYFFKFITINSVTINHLSVFKATKIPFTSYGKISKLVFFR